MPYQYALKTDLGPGDVAARLADPILKYCLYPREFIQDSPDPLVLWWKPAVFPDADIDVKVLSFIEFRQNILCWPRRVSASCALVRLL